MLNFMIQREENYESMINLLTFKKDSETHIRFITQTNKQFLISI